MFARPVVAGIDPSYTGFAVCVGNASEHVMQRFSSAPAKGPNGKTKPVIRVADRMKRLDDLVGDVNRFLQKYDPDVIFIENYSFGSKFNREAMAEVGAITRWHLVDFTPLVFEVSPMTLKKFVTGSGKGGKDQVAAHVVSRWGCLFSNNDEVDAFALYQLGLLCAGMIDAKNQKDREVMKTVLKDCDLMFDLQAMLDTPVF